MPLRFLKNADRVPVAIKQRRNERLDADNGVDVRSMDVDELGDTTASTTLKEIIRSINAQKGEVKGSG
jgi:hypothetical protein